ncbi:hypothetical protein DFP73DRAFT_126737 [Morchella snyderi]|nr:hypothetical protein DFP73DRAFT_126737 [Morchella snyderi]
MPYLLLNDWLPYHTRTWCKGIKKLLGSFFGNESPIKLVTDSQWTFILSIFSSAILSGVPCVVVVGGGPKESISESAAGPLSHSHPLSLPLSLFFFLPTVWITLPPPPSPPTRR